MGTIAFKSEPMEYKQQQFDFALAACRDIQQKNNGKCKMSSFGLNLKLETLYHIQISSDFISCIET